MTTQRKLVKAITIVVLVILLITGSVAPAVLTDSSASSISANQTKPWDHAAVSIWIAADSQPDRNNGPNPWVRLNSSAEDIDSLPIEPDYILMPGDIADPNDIGNRNGDAAAINAIKKTRSSYDRISWFRTEPSEGALITTGNHEWNYGDEFSQHFGGLCDSSGDKLIQMNTSVNMRFYGSCGTEQRPVYYTSSFTTLDSELATGEQTRPDMNVITTMHQPVPGTLSDCHTLNTNDDINWMADSSKADYLNLASKYGKSILAATINGHTHGRYEDPGVSQMQQDGVTLLDSPVFGGGLTTEGTTGCEENPGGAGDSMFLITHYGSDTAQAYIRHSCDDANPVDGSCDVAPYWGPTNISIPLNHPVQPEQGVRRFYADSDRAVYQNVQDGKVVHYGNTSTAREVSKISASGSGEFAIRKLADTTDQHHFATLSTKAASDGFTVTISGLPSGAEMEVAASSGKSIRKFTTSDGKLHIPAGRFEHTTLRVYNTDVDDTTVETTDDSRLPAFAFV